MSTENTRLSKCSTCFGYSLAFTSVVNSLLVIAKEKIPFVMSRLKAITGHHWITHCVIVIVFYFALAMGLAQLNRGQGPNPTAKNLIRTIFAGVILGGLAIIGFYLLAD